ncbi:MAG: EAL domain-containing protein, partial [Gemmatimonadetes bacterium]|nr:EAL domain-containing protein [Gemmatimonadota bacterium]
IVETIITLAEDLGINVIAEGVETEEQTARLKALRCDHAQGFLFREPVDAEAATSLLAVQLKRRQSKAIQR